MDLTLTEDQQLVQDTARDLLRSRAANAGVRATRGDPNGYSTELWREMVELGWTGLALPEEYGGVGSGFLEACLLVEELGRFQVPSPYLTTVACCALPIAKFGTEEQRKAWLGAIAGGRVVSYVRAAPGGQWDGDGSDVVATDTGDGFALDGTALFVPYAAAADGLLVLARRGGDGGSAALTALLVDAGTAGIGHRPLDVVGTDRQFQVVFDDVRVAGDRVLGGVGGGRDVAVVAAAYGAAATCAEMVGGAQQVLDRTVEYASQRTQFGHPIGSFQAVQHHCADMAVDVLGSRFIAYEAIWRLSTGADAAVEVATAKAWVSEAYQRVCALGHQVHGAIGFTSEHDLHHYSQHAMAAALTFGDADQHLDRLAHHLGL